MRARVGLNGHAADRGRPVTAEAAAERSWLPADDSHLRAWELGRGPLFRKVACLPPADLLSPPRSLFLLKE